MFIEGRSERGSEQGNLGKFKMERWKVRQRKYEWNLKSFRFSSGLKELVCSAVTSVGSHRVGHVRHGWFSLRRMRPWVDSLGPLDWEICCITLDTRICIDLLEGTECIL